MWFQKFFFILESYAWNAFVEMACLLVIQIELQDMWNSKIFIKNHFIFKNQAQFSQNTMFSITVVAKESLSVVLSTYIEIPQVAHCPKQPKNENSFWKCVSRNICFLICDFHRVCWFLGHESCIAELIILVTSCSSNCRP